MTSRLAAIQLRAEPNATLEENVERAMQSVDQIGSGADLVVLPEYFSTSYFPSDQDPDDFNLALEENDPVLRIVKRTAAESETAVVAPLFEKGMAGGRYYNTAFVIDRRGTQVGKYRKLHPFQRPGYNERYYFAPGNLGVPVFDVAGIKFGIMLCYDRHFPEIARVAALRGAEAMLVPTCSFGEENRDRVWLKELTGIAVANSLYVLGVNRAGSDGGKTHFGATTAVDPRGNELNTLDADPGKLLVDIDPSLVEEVRRTTKHLNDVREELLPDLDSL